MLKIFFVILFLSNRSHAQISADFGGAGGGAVRFGESVATCDASTQGAIRYESVGMTMRFCDAFLWQSFFTETCVSTQPADWSFTNVINQATSTVVASSIHQVTGISGCTMGIKVSGSGSPEYRICDDATCTSVSQTWGTAQSTITNNKYVQIRLTSSGTANTQNSATLTIGTRLESWFVTTTGDCSTADPGVGTICADGSVYIGISPDSGTKMYVTACDIGRTMSGITCSGTVTTFLWSTAATVSAGVTDPVRGETNTTNLMFLINGDSPFPAAAYCDSLTMHGQSDWYLPSMFEIQHLIVGCGVIPDVSCGNTSRRWTSTENSATHAYYYSQSGITSGVSPKAASNYGVRCFRKD